MPSRVIRDSLLSSRSLSHVSIGAESFFTRLLLVVDDFGRFDARLEVIASAVYPARRSVGPDQVSEWLDELCAEGCVHRYEIDGDAYLQLIGWEKHRGKGRRAQSSKYPEPLSSEKSADFRGSPGKSAKSARETRDVRREAGDERREEDPPPLPRAGTAEAPVAPASGDVEKLLPLLKNQPGDEASKRAWLAEELDVIAADVDAGVGKWPQLVIRYYRHHLRKPALEQRRMSFDEQREAGLVAEAERLTEMRRNQ